MAVSVDYTAHSTAPSVCILLCIHFKLYLKSLLTPLALLYLCNISCGQSIRNLDCRFSIIVWFLKGEGQKDSSGTPSFHCLHPATGLLIWCLDCEYGYTTPTRSGDSLYCCCCVSCHTDHVTMWIHVRPNIWREV